MNRERLTELLDDALAVYDVIVYALPHTDEIADYLLANGVTVQKRGRWEFKGTAYACSECGTGFPAPVSYCFNCGAKMEE